MKQFSVDEYHLPFFDEQGHIRKLCPLCNEYYWTLIPDQEVCGESTPHGCASYTFINNSPMPKRYTLNEMRECFLSFFEKRGHERIKPYPVVARWRDDLYFTNASIVDFQPYVTNGIAPPPANPLVISQPCIRFVDVDNVGPTFGRHLTIFEMGGHHAFNYPNEEIYWKDETIRFHHEFVTKELGVDSAEVIYKEGVWSGGGNAGPDFEPIIRGLETSTLVFMKYKVSDGEFIELPIRTIDTGYGIERFTWLSQGSISCFHAIYGPILTRVFELANLTIKDESLLEKIAEFSGLMNSDKTIGRNKGRKRLSKTLGITMDQLDKILTPIENSFAVLDHTKCLIFMLSEGVVPSNIKEGYLARLMLRRTYRSLRNLHIDESLFDLINLQIDFWSKDFPRLEEMREGILEILTTERDKYIQTLKRGRSIVKRLTWDLKNQGETQISTEKLIELYDSHGLSPEIVKETGESEKIDVNIPENFYAMVAARHEKSPSFNKTKTFKELEDRVSSLPETGMLYYSDPYIREFKTKLLRVLDGKYVILEETAFYPESGGQPADLGYLETNRRKFRVIDVQKIGKVIIHTIDDQIVTEFSQIIGYIDWDRRYNLMRSHTATHILMGAARRVLGEHVWQAGAQKGIEKSRLDISHFRRLTTEEIQELELLSNRVVLSNKSIDISWMPREEAEGQYGFRLYQGGAVLGKDIRVVKTEDWEVEACGGTHLNSTGEVGLIKIVNTERIQDGVERIIFSTGLSALKAIQKRENTLLNTSKILGVSPEQVENTTERLAIDFKETRREREKLMDRLAEFTAKEFLVDHSELSGLKLITKVVKEENVGLMLKIADIIVTLEPLAVVILFLVEKTVHVVIMVGKEAVKRNAKANRIASALASILGGGGSGDSAFAQGGGPLIKNVSKAVQKVGEIIVKQLGGDHIIS